MLQFSLCILSVQGLLLKATEPCESSPQNLQYASSSAHQQLSSFASARKLLQTSPSGAPSKVPPARRFVSLSLSSDGNHHHLPVRYNNQSLELIVDTGSSDLMVFDSRFCAGSFLHSGCYVFNASESNITSLPPRFQFKLHLDNEVIVDPFPRKIGGNLQLDASVLGTTGKQVMERATESYLSSNMVFDTVRAPYTALHAFPGADGLVGFAYSDLSSFGGSAGMRLLNPSIPPYPVFAMDLNGPEKESRLWIGGIDEEYRDRLVWGGPDSIAYHTFMIRELKVCGVDLIDNFTDYSFHGLVDTGASCLGLPQELFDSLISWLPVVCHTRTFLTGGLRQDVQCVLKPDVPTVLPTLTFIMSPATGRDNDHTPLHLPLEDLLIGRQLCLRRTDAVVPGVGVVSFGISTISFGNRALRSLFTVFHGPTAQMAMANKNPQQTSSDIQCVPRTVCKGMQEAYTALNQCVDPPCSDYYFFEFDDDEKVCYLSATFHIIGATLLAAFFGAEVLMTELELWLGRRIDTIFRPTPLR